MQTVLVKRESHPPGKVIVLPDTQFETAVAPEILAPMLDHILSVDPDLVIGVGDITDGAHTFWSDWPRAKAFYDSLTANGIPWVAAIGNHDYTNDITRAEVFNASFSAPPNCTFKDAGHMENHYRTVTLGGIDWLVLVLEWSPRDVVVTWANSILAANADKPAIVVTHAYLYNNGNRYDWGTYGNAQSGSPYEIGSTPLEGINDGRDLWEKLVLPNENVRLVLSGHVGTPGPGPLYRSDTRLSGNLCHQITQCYQEVAPFGAGWIVEYQFDSINNDIFARTYSPYLKRELTGIAANDFRLSL